MEQAAMTAREIVETALGPLRTGYVFPDLAERAAAQGPGDKGGCRCG